MYEAVGGVLQEVAQEKEEEEILTLCGQLLKAIKVSVPPVDSGFSRGGSGHGLSLGNRPRPNVMGAAMAYLPLFSWAMSNIKSISQGKCKRD